MNIIKIYNELTLVNGKFDLINYLNSFKYVSNGIKIAKIIKMNHEDKKIISGFNSYTNDVNVNNFKLAELEDENGNKYFVKYITSYK